MRRCALLLVLVAVATIAAGCGNSRPVSPATNVRGPGFRASPGWHLFQNGLSSPPFGSVATAASFPVARADRGQSDPEHTVASLPRDGVVIWVQFASRHASARSNKYYPLRELPLRLRESISLDGMPEGMTCPRACAVRSLESSVAGYNIFLFVFFGRTRPTAAMSAAANAELARLFLPGCPRNAERIAPDGPRAAARATLAWLRTYWWEVGVMAHRELRGAQASASTVSPTSSDRRLRAAARVCGSQANRILAVTITPSRLGRKAFGADLLYFVAKTPHGWLVWRQG